MHLVCIVENTAEANKESTDKILVCLYGESKLFFKRVLIPTNEIFVSKK